MRIQKLIKNIFIILFFIVPIFTFAEHWADKYNNGVSASLIENVNLYSGNAFYNNHPNRLDNIIDGTTDNPTRTNLSLNKTNTSIGVSNIELESFEFEALKIKINKELPNSPLATELNKYKKEDLYAINTRSGTYYVLRSTARNPKDNNPSNNLIIGVATKDDRFLILENPIGKDSKEAETSLFNLVDNMVETETGTSYADKNSLYNLEQEKQSAAEDVKQKEQALEEAKKTNNQVAIDAAEAALNQSKNNLSNTENKLQNEKQRVASTRSNSDENKCDQLFDVFVSSDCLFYRIAKITNFILKLTSFITYTVGILFDYSLEVSINSAEFIQALGVVEVSWTFIRDVLNITFIFILLWISILLLITNNEKQYNLKTSLVRVISVAVLINFSLFAAQIMVDGSNIVSLKIYESMKSSGMKDKDNKDTNNKTATISERVMNTVGLTTTYNVKGLFADDLYAGTGGCSTEEGGQWKSIIILHIMTSFFLLIVCLALGLAAVLFMIRLVNIIVLFIKSPLWVWGYVMPSDRFKDIRKNWEKDMKHVLTFPILYLFWMFIAVLAFTKLGEINQQTGTSLLTLICNPSKDTLTQSISLVAIFAITIIFLMNAVKYGVKHSSESGIAGKFASSAANKVGGWQDALTAGLLKKSWNTGKNLTTGAAGLAGAGALMAGKGLASQTGRVGMGTIKAFKSNKNEKWDGFKDGYMNPGINMKEGIRNVAANLSSDTWYGRQMAKLASKYDKPKNSLGETKEEADKRRSKGAAEQEEVLFKALDRRYKIMSQKDWQKKNANGTDADYIKYIEDTATERATALFGKNILNMTAKNGKTHLENLRAAAAEKKTVFDGDENNKDSNGNRKTKDVYNFNAANMHNVLEDMIKYHTEDDDGKQALKGITNPKARIETMRNIKAMARLKTLGEQSKTEANKAKNKDAMKKEIQDMENKLSQLEKLPTEADLTKHWADNTNVYSDDNKNENNPIVKEYNEKIDKILYNRNLTQDQVKEKVKQALKDYAQKHKESQEKLNKLRNTIISKKKALEAEEKK